MPGPWRPFHRKNRDMVTWCFNLRRDARPLATRYPPKHGNASVEVSISDEMPGPWRLSQIHDLLDSEPRFQSQTRCQAPGDFSDHSLPVLSTQVSISDEMPGPWRLVALQHNIRLPPRFNLRRDAR